MADNVTIVEKNEKVDGIVIHHLVVGGDTLYDNLDYIQVRDEAAKYIEPHTVVTEIYESTDEKVTTTGHLVLQL